MSSMLILGNRYQLNQKEIELIENNVEKLFTLNINHNDSQNEKIIKNINDFLKKEKVSYIVLNLEKKINLNLKSYLEELDYQGINFLTYSDFCRIFLNKYHIEFNEKNFNALQNIQHNLKNTIQKRVFDFIFSLIALILLSPIFLIISILIKVKSPDGDIFFGHQRIGKDGKLFRVYKFRTMVPNAHEKLQKMLNENPKIKAEYEKDFKLKNDPRIIPNIGKFLRQSSLDELPQFFNSLIGDLSVVGPRPIVVDEVKKYGKYSSKLFSVKPGVTGLWQVSGRNDIDYDERVELDMKYIDNQSFWMDIKIIFKTVKVMVFKEGN